MFLECPDVWVGAVVIFFKQSKPSTCTCSLLKKECKRIIPEVDTDIQKFFISENSLSCFLFQFPDGFISHYYCIAEIVSPVLAWGFLGPESKLKHLCTNFKVKASFLFFCVPQELRVKASFLFFLILCVPQELRGIHCCCFFCADPIDISCNVGETLFCCTV